MPTTARPNGDAETTTAPLWWPKTRETAADPKLRVVLLLRAVLTTAGAFLLFAMRRDIPAALTLVATGFIWSNAIVALTSARVLRRRGFMGVLLLLDTLVVSVIMTAVPAAQAEALLLYFVIILMACVHGGGELAPLAWVVTSAAYVACLSMQRGAGALLEPALIVRIIFALIAGGFYVILRDPRSGFGARPAEPVSQEGGVAGALR